MKRRGEDEAGLFATKAKGKQIPFGFVLDELAPVDPQTRPMFGCTAVYVGDKIVFALRDKGGGDQDSGVWLATTKDHHASLAREMPNLRSITVFGSGESSWRVLPKTALDFEESVLHACDLVKKGDPRVGTIPKVKKPRRTKAK
jgi:hypothetical protein